MSDIKIITGRSTKSVRAKALREGTKDVLAGADVDYFLVPKQRKSESDSQYISRLWRLNKDFLTSSSGEGTIPMTQRNYTRFKEEIVARKKLVGKDVKPASFQKGESAAEWGAKNAVRTLWEDKEQRARANSISGLKRAGAWAKFRQWSRGTGEFSMSKLTYNEKENRYEYAGKVAFKWDYKKAKRGEPGGMAFTITNLRTGVSMTQEDLADERVEREMRRHGIAA